MKKFALYGLVLLLATGATWFQLQYRKPPLPKYKALPDFALTERSGETVRLSDLKGKVWLADFIYTTCPGPCPMLSSHFRGLQEQALRDDDVRLVSITLTPEKDTPEVLRAYADHFGAKPHWLFLTGKKDEVVELIVKGFLQSRVEQDDPVNPVVHSTKLALVDRDGNLRAFYDGGSAEQNERILSDIRRLRRE